MHMNGAAIFKRAQSGLGKASLLGLTDLVVCLCQYCLGNSDEIIAKRVKLIHQRQRKIS